MNISLFLHKNKYIITLKAKLDSVTRVKILTILTTGADPGFLEGGFKSTKRGFVFDILADFS